MSGTKVMVQKPILPQNQKIAEMHVSHRRHRIERNETVERKEVRFKPEPSPESLHYRGLYICATGLDILKI